MRPYRFDRDLACPALMASLMALLPVSPAAAQVPFGLRDHPGAIPSGPPMVAPPDIQAFAGVWSVKKSWKTGPVPTKGQIPFTPEFEAKRAKLEQMDKNNIVLPGRNAKCVPGGLMDQFTFGFRVEANAEYMLVIGGEGPTLRPIWLHQKQHTPPDQLFPSYQGESIGRLEGKTLVIDTIGLNSGNEYTYALPADDANVHVVEHWKLNSPNELQVTGTVDDAKAFTKPWTWTMIYGRAPLTDPISYCDYPSKAGGLDLTPPPEGYIPPGADK